MADHRLIGSGDGSLCGLASTQEGEGNTSTS